MDKQSFSGKTLDEALERAAQALGVSVGQVSYSKVNAAQNANGLLSKLFRSEDIKIEAWVDTHGGKDLQAAAREAVNEALSPKQKRPQQPRRNNNEGRNEQRNEGRKNQPPRERAARPQQQQQQQQQQNPPQAPRPQQAEAQHEQQPSENEGQEEQAFNARPKLNLESPGVNEVLESCLIHFLKIFQIEASKNSYSIENEGPDQVTITIADTFLEESFSRTDRLSCAFEHVFKRVAQKKLGDVAGRVSLEAGQSVAIRHDRLTGMASSMADKVKRTGRSISVNAKSSQERRIIHLALEGMEGIGTKSVGTGDGRKLIIYSTAENHQRRRGNGHRNNNNNRRHHGRRGNNNGNYQQNNNGNYNGNRFPDEGESQPVDDSALQNQYAREMGHHQEAQD